MEQTREIKFAIKCNTEEEARECRKHIENKLQQISVIDKDEKTEPLYYYDN
jgi:hypothetical protein